MISSLLATERAAHREREILRRRERMAAGALRALRPGVSRERIEELAMERWGLTPEETRAVGEVTERMREVGGRTVTIEQLRKGDGMARSEGWTKVREATRRILTEHPSITRTEAYEQVKAAAGTSMMFSSWQTEHYYPVRREIEIGRATRKPGPPAEDPRIPPQPVPIPPPEPLPPSVPARATAASSSVATQTVEALLRERLAVIDQEAAELRLTLGVIARYIPS